MGDGWQYRQAIVPPPQEEDAMQHPVAFIGIGSKNEQEMQQLIIEEKVGIYLWKVVSIYIINIIYSG